MQFGGRGLSKTCVKVGDSASLLVKQKLAVTVLLMVMTLLAISEGRINRTALNESGGTI
jgi:hypothetical protein